MHNKTQHVDNRTHESCVNCFAILSHNLRAPYCQCAQRYAGPKNMNCKHLKIILISFFIVPYNTSADQAGLSLEPLAIANINCAAFYTAAQVLIKPEAKKEYESKSSIHHALSYRLSSSQETISSNLNNEIQRQATEALSLKEHAQAVKFLSDNSIKCSIIEINSNAIIKNNSIN